MVRKLGFRPFPTNGDETEGHGTEDCRVGRGFGYGSRLRSVFQAEEAAPAVRKLPALVGDGAEVRVANSEACAVLRRLGARQLNVGHGRVAASQVGNVLGIGI